MEQDFVARDAATPTALQQLARHRRIFETAAEMGTNLRYAHISMIAVADASSVALGTLYRYFPSKTHLFATLFYNRVAHHIAEHWSHTGPDRATLVAHNLAELNRVLLAEPRLCATMLRATAAAYLNHRASHVVWAQLETVLCKTILATVGESDPTTEHLDAALLVVYCWWGAINATLNARITQQCAEFQLHVATTALLAFTP